jgi:membrane-associated protein
MELLSSLIDFILHIDKHLDILIQSYGSMTYAILFLIVFCETGLVVTPFLPGDSLLFAIGTFTARESLSFPVTWALLLAAAVSGDAVNYAVGKYLGQRVYQMKNSRFFRKEYLERTQRFFDKYGAKAIVLARFVPIVRTFAPFLAGVGEMSYRKFFVYNVGGALLWVTLLLGAGHLFGEMPVVRNNFSLVVFGIIGVSLLPIVIEMYRARTAKQL